MLLSLLNWLFEKLVKPADLGYALENYISSRNPQTIGDVERLEKEFAEQLKNGGFKCHF